MIVNALRSTLKKSGEAQVPRVGPYPGLDLPGVKAFQLQVQSTSDVAAFCCVAAQSKKDFKFLAGPPKFGSSGTRTVSLYLFQAVTTSRKLLYHTLCTDGADIL
eukprot:2716604-Rhodomonas_salina.2